MTSRLACVAFVAPMLAACTYSYLPTNAPGHIDVHEPPSDLADHALEPPKDPGEHLLILSYGAFAGAGAVAGGADSGSAAYGIGPEVSLAKGVRDFSSRDTLFPAIMSRGLGMNLGWTALTGLGRSVGPLYAEAELRVDFVSIAGGWAWAAADHTHGPQGTIAFGPLYVRATDEIDLGTQVTVGLLFKASHAWVWSR